MAILHDIEQLPPNAQQQLIAFVAELKKRYTQPHQPVQAKSSFAAIAGILANKSNGATLTIEQINDAIVKAAVQANT